MAYAIGESMPEQVASFTFLVWFLLSAVHQLRKVPPFIRERDVFGLLPNWSFFAPTPGSSDWRLVVRECRVDLTFGEWHEATPPYSGRLRAIWNPEQLEQKALSDVLSCFMDHLRVVPDLKIIQFSWPYLALLAVVEECDLGEDAESARQFAVIETKEGGCAK